MELLIESFDHKSIENVKRRAEDFVDDFRHLHLWGAGHVGRALVLALAPLPFKISWWDQRLNAFPAVVPQNVMCRSGSPDEMEPHSMVMVMSHSHALDFEIIDVALRNPAFQFVGLIGSATKRARFVKRLHDAGVNPARLTCPIGSTEIRSKHPAHIAAGVAFQLLQQDELLKTQRLDSEFAVKSLKVLA